MEAFVVWGVVESFFILPPSPPDVSHDGERGKGHVKYGRIQCGSRAVAELRGRFGADGTLGMQRLGSEGCEHGQSEQSFLPHFKFNFGAKI